MRNCLKMLVASVILLTLTVAPVAAYPAMVEEALQNLTDMDPAVRSMGVQTLRVFAAEAPDTLDKVLDAAKNDPEPEVQRYAILALIEFAGIQDDPEPVLSKVAPFLQSDDLATQLCACVVAEKYPSSEFSKSNGDERFAIYEKAILSKDSEVPDLLAQALSASRDTKTLPMLEKMLTQKSTVNMGVSALGERPEKEAKRILIDFTKNALLSDDEEMVSRGVRIADGLGTDIPLVAAELKKVSESKNAAGLMAAAILYVTEPNTDNFAPLKAGLGSDQPELQREALGYLSLAKPAEFKSVKPELLALLNNDEDPDTAAYVMLVVSSQKPIDVDFLEVAMKQAESKDPSARLNVARVSTDFGVDSAKALPTLEKLLKDEEADVRVVAIRAIFSLTGELKRVKSAIDAFAKDPKELELLVQSLYLGGGGELNTYVLGLLKDAASKGDKKAVELYASQVQTPDNDDLQLFLQHYGDLEKYVRYSLMARLEEMHPARKGVLELLELGLKDEESEVRWVAARVDIRFSGSTERVEEFLRKAFAKGDTEELSQALSLMLSFDQLAVKFADELVQVVRDKGDSNLKNYAFVSLQSVDSLSDKVTEAALILLRDGEFTALSGLRDKKAQLLDSQLTASDRAILSKKLAELSKNSKSWYRTDSELSIILTIINNTSGWSDKLVEPLKIIKNQHPSETARDQAKRALSLLEE